MACQKSFIDQMAIDPEKVSGIIAGFLREKVNAQGTRGIALGLSGGVDSAVVATLAARAVGPSNVYALHLSDRDSQGRFLRYAEKVAGKFAINLEIRDITPLVREQGVYRPLAVKATSSIPGLGKLLVQVCRVVCLRVFRVNPYALVLTQGQAIRGKFTRRVYKNLAGTLEAGFSARHIQRRRILENYASEKNLLLVGAANRSESMVGWFVKDGVDDLPLEPLLGLYKTQVRQLARFLDIPREIIQETPSPDMMKGVTDEMVIGFPYDKLDMVLYALEHALDERAVLDAGISPGELESIRKLNQLSAWKRENPHESPRLE